MSDRAKQILEQLATLIADHESGGKSWAFKQTLGSFGEDAQHVISANRLLTKSEVMKHNRVLHSLTFEFSNWPA